MKIIFSAVGSMGYVGLIKEFQNAGLDVIGIDADPLSVGFSFTKKSYIVPFGSDPAFIEEIINIIENEHVDAIISNPEEELLPLSRNRELFESRGVLLLCPDFKAIEICAYKKKTYDFFRKLGIPMPNQYSTGSINYPCIIKPNFGRGSANVYYARNKKELSFFLNKVEDPIIQEFIKGEEYSVDILADRDGNSLSIVPRLRLDIESGISVRSKTIYNSEMIEHCKSIVKELKLFGPSCIQCIKNEEEIKFFEVNTRFGGGSILSLEADPSIIPNLIRLINNKKPIPSKGFIEGLIMRRYYSEVFKKGIKN